ncbi:MAG: EpsI family protein, partial [Phycisphaerae bacterium]|nr:EpsI family protein [Phycisphaerae bacterium]
MSAKVAKLLWRLAAPAVTVALLLGMVAEQRRYLTEADFAPYHQRAAEAIDAVPWKIGTWAGVERPIVQEAQVLLKPNRILSRSYQDFDPKAGEDRRISLLIVQCKRSGDMVGHYPR